MASSSEDKKRSQIKEKVVAIYERLFLGQDITQGRANFWDEFFLLTPNLKSFFQLCERTNVSSIKDLQPHINRLFSMAVGTALKSPLWLRVACAMQTVDCILVGLTLIKKEATELPPFDSLAFLSASMTKEINLKRVFVINCADSRPVVLRRIALNSLALWLTLQDEICQNHLIRSLMEEEQFIRSLLYFLSDMKSRSLFAPQICQIFILFEQYHKQHHPGTPSMLHLWVDEILVNNVSFCIAQTLSDTNMEYRRKIEEPTGFFSSFQSLIFASSTRVATTEAAGYAKTGNGLMLLCLYEAFHRQFDYCCSILLYSHVNSTQDDISLDAYCSENSSPDNEVSTGTTESGQEDAVFGGLHNSRDNHPLGDASSCANNGAASSSVMGSEALTGSDDLDSLAVAGTSKQTSGAYFYNVFSDLIEYTSIVMLDFRVPELAEASRMCFIIWRLITENKSTAMILHDIHFNFKATIHKTRTRHRSPQQSKSEQKNCPGAILLLDLVVEFLSYHLMRTLPVAVYRDCLAIVHQLLCYQRQWGIRLEYNWRPLWLALLSLMKFLPNLDVAMLPETLPLLHQVMLVMDFFLVRGDSILRMPQDYDSLMYELVRAADSIESLHEFAMKHGGKQHGDALEKVRAQAILVAQRMINPRTVVKHFQLKISQYSPQPVSITEQQVLSVIQENYATLNLILPKDLEKPLTYHEEDEAFAKHYVRSLVQQYRKQALETASELQSQFSELTSI